MIRATRPALSPLVSSLSFALSCSLLSGAALAQVAPEPAPAAEATVAQKAAPGPTLESADARLKAALAPRPGGLTSREVADKAVAVSPTLRAKQAQIEASQAEVEGTTASFFPRLTLKASYTRLSPVDISLGGGGAIVGTTAPGPVVVGPCPGGGGAQCVLDSAGNPAGAVAFTIESPLNNYALTAGLSIPISDYILRLGDARAAADSSEQAARLAKDAELPTVENEARVAYYNWARTLGQVAVAKASLERATALRDDGQTAFKLGAATRADVMRLEALVAQAESMVEQASALRSLSERQLGVLMNEKPRPYELGEDLMAEDARLASSEDLPALVDEAKGRRLELKAIEESKRSVEYGADAVRAARYPRLDGFADLTYANPNQRAFGSTGWTGSWSVGAALTWTVNDVFVQGSNAAQIDATSRRLTAEQESIARGIEMQVTAAYLDRKRAEASLRATTRGAEASEEAYRVTADLYRAGRATTTDVIASESELVTAFLQRVNAQIDLKVANVSLAHAVGRER